MAFWQATYGGTTKDAADWGISNLKRKRKSTSTDKVTFKLDGTLFDTSPLPFAWLQPLSITRNGLPWFSGVVTQPEPKATGKAESIAYEISGPWYWLEKTVFQQQWVTISTAGAGLVTGTTTKSETILGQSLDGIKMNSGQVLREVLIYAQYAYQMIPFPATVDTNHLPTPPATAAPFIIGTITPDITVPYMTVRDKSCADIIRQMLKYSPDAIAWFDYSTSPPTLNIGQRAGLTQRAIPLYGGPVTGAFATAFNPKPRYDLQVPVVVAKFQEKNEINGTTYASTTVDVYPPAPAGVDPGAWASQPRAWVQTIDLIGGHTTQQSTDIKVLARPNAAADTVAVPWALKKQPWLTSLTTIPAAVIGIPKFDFVNVGVAYINTIIDPDDPLNDPDQNPNDITITADKKGPDCNQLVAELLPGGFPPWLQEDPNHLDCAKVTIEVHLNYTGTDPATAQYFVQDPSSGLNVLSAGSGVFIFHYPCKVTNAETQTYSQLTSWAASEPVPTGFAMALYNSLKLLHYEGTLEMIEDECSDQLPPGTTFNAIGGNPDWAAMQALVLEVTEDIDNGATSVQFGPPAFLSLGEMEQLFRANLGVLPAWKLEQRTSGVTTAGANVIGAQHYADTHVVNPPSIPSVSKLPWAVIMNPKASTATVNASSLLMRTLKQGDNQPVDNLAPATIAITCTESSKDFIYLEQAVSNYVATGNAKIFSKTSAAGQPNIFDPTLEAWDSSNNAYLANGGTSDQTFFRVLLGTIATGPAVGGVTPSPVYTPSCVANLLIYYCTIGGLKAINAYQTPTSSIASTP